MNNHITGGTLGTELQCAAPTAEIARCGSGKFDFRRLCATGVIAYICECEISSSRERGKVMIILHWPVTAEFKGARATFNAIAERCALLQLHGDYERSLSAASRRE